MIQRAQIPGIILASSIGIFALIATSFFSSLNAVMLALILGVVIANVFKLSSVFVPGFKVTASRLLEFSILFLAFGINYNHFLDLGVGRFLSIVALIGVVLLLTVYLARTFNCPGASVWLIGFGTAICGSSAIAALAPSVSRNQEDTGLAMAVVNLYGALGMMVMPWLFQYLPISHQDAGFIIGASLHSVANVAGAAFSMDQAVGESALTIKLARVAMLSPGLILINWLLKRKESGNKGLWQLPWYMYGFIAITILVSLVPIPQPMLKGAEFLGKVSLTIALAAVGLGIYLKSILTAGKRGLSFGFMIFAIQTLLILLILIVGL
jgi:uncharacterized integral membrane protein (TIGR00698 family)